VNAYLLNPDIEGKDDVPEADDQVVDDNESNVSGMTRYSTISGRRRNRPRRRRLGAEVSHNFRIIKTSLQIPTLRNTLMFFILQGFTIPTFS